MTYPSKLNIVETEFTVWRQQQLQLVEDFLIKLLNQDTPLALLQPMRYAVLGGGKRLRALLVLATSQALAADVDLALRAAAAVELIHAYSLVHDDMPCMDNDKLRRGKPTVHVEFGEDKALLAGDALQALAFEVITPQTEQSRQALLQAKLCRILAHAAGGRGMAGGQAIDLASVQNLLSEQQLREMHRLKTGALIHAAVMLGAACAEQTDAKVLAALSDYGWAIGLAFQVVDDVLDETSSTSVLGKTSGKDKQAGKPTYVSTMGLAAAADYAQQLLDEALASLAKIKQIDTQHLQNLADAVVNRNS